MIDMATKQIIPAVVKYTTTLADSVSAVRSACAEASVKVQTDLLVEVSALLEDAKDALEALKRAEAEAKAKTDNKDKAYFFKDIVMPAMAKLRAPVDKLEMLVDKEAWPMPSYGDLIFEV